MIATGMPTSSHPTNFNIGAAEFNANPVDMIIDNIKTFSEAVLPFGAFHIGNGNGLLADIDNPHKDLTFFWDAQSTAAKGGTNLATSKTGTLGSANTGGTTSFPTSGGIVGGHFDNESTSANYYCYFPVSSDDIFDGSKGCLGIWFTFETIGGWYRLCGFGDATNYFELVINDSYQMYSHFYLAGTEDYTTTNTTVISVNKWYWLLVQWDVDIDRMDLSINGVKAIGTATPSNSWGHSGTGNFYFGAGPTGINNADVKIGRVFISKDPDTPEIWTAFGKPLHVPLIDKQ
jgi:hypothetical protein